MQCELFRAIHPVAPAICGSTMVHVVLRVQHASLHPSELNNKRHQSKPTHLPVQLVAAKWAPSIPMLGPLFWDRKAQPKARKVSSLVWFWGVPVNINSSSCSSSLEISISSSDEFPLTPLRPTGENATLRLIGGLVWWRFFHLALDWWLGLVVWMLGLVPSNLVSNRSWSLCGLCNQ